MHIRDGSNLDREKFRQKLEASGGVTYQISDLSRQSSGSSRKSKKTVKAEKAAAAAAAATTAANTAANALIGSAYGNNSSSGSGVMPPPTKGLSPDKIAAAERWW